MASFHRFPGLEPVHTLLTGNAKVAVVLTELLEPALRTIGMSDITVNRSQQWHKDLLRGKFSRYVADENPCANHSGKLFKVILYLQDSASLLVVRAHIVTTFRWIMTTTRFRRRANLFRELRHTWGTR